MTKRSEEFVVPNVIFLCEQVGVSEKELKTRLAALLAEAKIIERAYLAQVSYGISGPRCVALCLRANAEPKLALMESLGQAFTSAFNENVQLDIFVVNEEQEQQLRKVCQPFFNQNKT